MKTRVEYLKSLFEDRRTKKVVRFFVGKGFLLGDVEKSKKQIKLYIPDVLWVARNVEPRVLEVLPAALIHYPNSFFGKNWLPEELEKIVKKIKRGEMDHKDYRGISYLDMKRWAERPLPDHRTKPLSQIRINRTLRFDSPIYNVIKHRAKSQHLSIRAYLEALVRKDLKM